MSWLALPANLGVALYQAIVPPRRKGDKYEGVTGPPGELLRSSAFEEFLGAWSQEVRNHLIKSAGFYEWRLGAPGTRYQAFLVRRNGAVVAAAIGRVAELQGIPSFALLDIIALRGEEGALTTLYHDVDREARRLSVEAIVAMMSSRQAKQYRLTRFGFIRSPFTFKLILRSVCDAVSVGSISSERDWH
jgi:hypothetical protein